MKKIDNDFAGEMIELAVMKTCAELGWRCDDTRARELAVFFKRTLKHVETFDKGRKKFETLPTHRE